ncbi:MAG TPA: hypothetical protein VLB86_04150 [Gaiellaceae bacterium]|nr:hypothetical protein [Gaiellaceae bacterium]
MAARRRGHLSGMDTNKPTEKVADLAREADRGRSERTPWLALGGVSMAIGAVVLVLVAILLLVYWLA